MIWSGVMNVYLEASTIAVARLDFRAEQRHNFELKGHDLDPLTTWGGANSDD